METIGIVGAILGLYWGHIRIVENNMETNILFSLSHILVIAIICIAYHAPGCLV